MILLIDGPPGAGKTTLAEAVARLKPDCRLILEMAVDHPLHPAPLSEMGADFGALNGVPPEEIVDLLVSKWKGFGASLGTNECVILESYPFQSHVRVLWQAAAPPDLIDTFFERVEKILHARQSYLIQLTVASSRDHGERILAARGQEWADFVSGFLAATPYGRQHGLSGPAGALDFLDAYVERLNAWYDRWNLPKMNLAAWSRRAEDLAQGIVSAVECSN